MMTLKKNEKLLKPGDTTLSKTYVASTNPDLIAKLIYLEAKTEELKLKLDIQAKIDRVKHYKEIEEKNDIINELKMEKEKLVERISKLEIENFQIKSQLKEMRKKNLPASIVSNEISKEQGKDSVGIEAKQPIVKENDVVQKESDSIASKRLEGREEEKPSEITIPLLPDLEAETAVGKKWILMLKNPLGFLPTILTTTRERLYRALASKEKNMCENSISIEKDIHRTLVETKAFELSNPNSQRLREILLAISYSRPDLGYTQGMNYYLGMLLLNCKNTESFFIASYCLTIPIIQACFSVNIDKIKAYGELFGKLLNSHAPKLGKYLESVQYQYQTYIFDSGASLFCGNFPYSTAIKVWDEILPSPETGILRVGIAVFKTMEQKLLTLAAEDILMTVKFPCQVISEEILLKEIQKTKFKDSEYLSLRKECLERFGIN